MEEGVYRCFSLPPTHITLAPSPSPLTLTQTQTPTLTLTNTLSDRSLGVAQVLDLREGRTP